MCDMIRKHVRKLYTTDDLDISNFDDQDLVQMSVVALALLLSLGCSDILSLTTTLSWFQSWLEKDNVQMYLSRLRSVKVTRRFTITLTPSEFRDKVSRILAPPNLCRWGQVRRSSGQTLSLLSSQTPDCKLGAGIDSPIEASVNFVPISILITNIIPPTGLIMNKSVDTHQKLLFYVKFEICIMVHFYIPPVIRSGTM